MNEQTDVIYVEVDHDLRECIQKYLPLAGISVTTVSGEKNYYRALDQGNFAVAVIDIGQSDQAGLLLAEYTRNNTQLAIIILTALNTLETRINSYNRGGDLFLSKPIECLELAAAIKSLASRRKQEQVSVPALTPLTDGWVLLRQGWRLIQPNGGILPLTRKEFQVMELLATTPGEPIARERLLAHIYLRNDEYTSQALDTLIRRLRSKISHHSDQTSPILTAYGIGYCFSAPVQIR